MSEEYDPFEPNTAPDGASRDLPRAGTIQAAAAAATHQPEAPLADELDALLDAYTQQAQQEVAAAKAAEQQRSRPRKAADKREAALKAPLPSDNKGYQLLSRMGYTPGQGLGRQRQGPAEPLQLLVKQGKAGLGVDEQRAAGKRAREQEAAAAEMERQRAAKHQQVAYKHRAADAFAARRLRGQLAAAMRCCASLDEGAGLAVADNPLLSWWESQQQQADAQTLEDMGGAKLPTQHQGAEQPDTTGTELEDEGLPEDVPDMDGSGGAVGPFFDLSTGKRAEQALLAALQYLRDVYCYCLYCGCRYGDAADLNSNCPGLLEQDHDS